MSSEEFAYNRARFSERRRELAVEWAGLVNIQWLTMASKTPKSRRCAAIGLRGARRRGDVESLAARK